MLSTIHYGFDEAAGFSSGEFRAGLFNGVAEISYADNREWFVSAISLQCDNGKFGKDAEGKMIPLSRAYDGPIFEAIAAHLEKFSRDHIQDAVNAAIDGDVDERPRLALVAAE
jgi:hypothetical protein